VTAPSDQPVRFDSVAADKNWRSGEDNCPATEFLETNLPRVFASELDKFGLQQSLARGRSMHGFILCFGLIERCLSASVSRLFHAGAVRRRAKGCWLDS